MMEELDKMPAESLCEVQRETWGEPATAAGGIRRYGEV